MADPDYWTRMAIAGCVKLVVFFAVVAVVVCVVYIFVWCLRRLSRWMRLSRLGGITTLEETLNYGCTLCQYSMEAGEKVRTLSCDHVFHCGGTANCADGIDKWLLIAPEMVCPLCRQSPHPVEPMKRPPVSSPSQSAQDLRAPLLAQGHDQTLPEASSSAAPAPPPAADVDTGFGVDTRDGAWMGLC